MQFDLENLNPGTWFDFPDGGRICLAYLSAEKANEIRKASIKKEIEYKKGQRFEFETVDEEKLSRMTYDATIQDWQGIESADGKVIPCASEMKYNLMQKSPTFAKTVRDLLEKLSEAEILEAEAERKNS